MAQFWPKTLPTSDESSHCLDTGCAPEDMLGKVDVASSCEIYQHHRAPFTGTVGHCVLLHSTHSHGGCCSVLAMDSPPQDLFLNLGTLSKSRVSLSKRVRQGWGYFGIGKRLLLFSPAGQIYPYMDNDTGLLTPATCTTVVSDLVPHSLYPRP